MVPTVTFMTRAVVPSMARPAYPIRARSDPVGPWPALDGRLGNGRLDISQPLNRLPLGGGDDRSVCGQASTFLAGRRNHPEPPGLPGPKNLVPVGHGVGASRACARSELTDRPQIRRGSPG